MLFIPRSSIPNIIYQKQIIYLTKNNNYHTHNNFYQTNSNFYLRNNNLYPTKKSFFVHLVLQSQTNTYTLGFQQIHPFQKSRLHVKFILLEYKNTLSDFSRYQHNKYSFCKVFQRISQLQLK